MRMTVRITSPNKGLTRINQRIRGMNKFSLLSNNGGCCLCGSCCNCDNCCCPCLSDPLFNFGLLTHTIGRSYRTDAILTGTASDVITDEWNLGSATVSGYDGTTTFDVCLVQTIELLFTFDRDNADPGKAIEISLNNVVIHTIDMNTYPAGDPQNATYTLDLTGETTCTNTISIRAYSAGAPTNEYCIVAITNVT